MPTFERDLELYGPGARRPKPFSPRQGRRYCRALARRHYENFTVASLLLPRALRQHFYNLYAYCRWADDLADETGDPEQSLRLLDWWESQLHGCYQGRSAHPVFVALEHTIREFGIPPDPFVDLLVAFRQDQRVTRYESFDQLLDYCRYSANPVGRLVLYLGRSFDLRARQAGRLDLHRPSTGQFPPGRGSGLGPRPSLPARESLRQHGYDASMFARRECNPAFRRLMAAEVSEAEGWLRRGLPLVNQVRPELRLDVALFIHGGLALLEALRRVEYDVWSARPVLSKLEKARILARCWWRLSRESRGKERA